MEEPLKMLVFLQISLPFFSISYVSKTLATFFKLSTLLLQACSEMAWCLVEKWTIGKLVWIWFDNVSSISPKYVTYHQKISKIWFWASKINFLQLWCTYHHVGLYQRKVGIISFSNMYDTYRATFKEWGQCPREISGRSKKLKCCKN